METVTVTIQFQGQAITVQGFGTALILTSNPTGFTEVRTYSSPDAVGADYAATTEAYQLANKVFSQVPRPSRVKIANLAGARNWSATLSVLNPIPATGKVVGCKLRNPNTDAEYTVSHTVAGGDTAATITADLLAQIDALADIQASAASATSITVQGDSVTAAGKKVRVYSLTGSLEYVDAEPAAGYATRLSEIQLLDSDFYGILIGSTSNANLTDVAAWAESREKFFFGLSQDGNEKRTGASVVGAALRLLGYRNTKVEFHPDGELQNAALAGIVLGKGWDQGTAPTLAFRRFAGVSPYVLTPTEENNLGTNNLGTYTTSHGISMSWAGKSAGGVYSDFVIFVHWLSARIRENVFSRLAAEERVPFTDEGIQKVEDWTWEVLARGRDRGGFSRDFPLTIRSPKAAEVPNVDRQARILGGGGISFSGVFAGAIHQVQVNGTVIEGTPST